MPVEIERKFLVKDDSWRQGADGTPYRQGYLSLDPERTVRVRLAGEKAFLTIKGKAVGAVCSEFEYPIPVQEALQMLDELCLGPQITKVRHCIDYGGRAWEVDEFAGSNKGLIVAEVELESEDAHVDLPPWVGEEVTGDPRYYNASLSQEPYSLWGEQGTIV